MNTFHFSSTDYSLPVFMYNKEGKLLYGVNKDQMFKYKNYFVEQIQFSPSIDIIKIEQINEESFIVGCNTQGAKYYQYYNVNHPSLQKEPINDSYQFINFYLLHNRLYLIIFSNTGYYSQEIIIEHNSLVSLGNPVLIKITNHPYNNNIF